MKNIKKCLSVLLVMIFIFACFCSCELRNKKYHLKLYSANKVFTFYTDVDIYGDGCSGDILIYEEETGKEFSCHYKTQHFIEFDRETWGPKEGSEYTVRQLEVPFTIYVEKNGKVSKIQEGKSSVYIYNDDKKMFYPE